MDKKTVVGQLLIEDTISQEEAKILLSKEEEDFEHEGSRVQIVSELLFGRLINSVEAAALLDPLNSDTHDLPSFEDLFNPESKGTDLVDINGQIVTVKYSFKPIQYRKQKLDDELPI